MFGSNFWQNVASVFAASLPGVIAVIVAQYLAQRREDQNTRRLYASARRLLALEVASNRASLDNFWRTINALDKEQKQNVQEHLAALAENGLLGYDLPHWSFSRWERLEADTYAAFTEKELAGIDQINRALAGVTDLYRDLVTLTPEDKADLAKNMGGRFWMNDFARMRDGTYSKLATAVQKVLSAANPLAQ